MTSPLRILRTIAITLAVIYIATRWIAPIALSYYEAAHAPAVAKVVPTNLKDVSISDQQRLELSYIGYDFEVPWTDLDEGETKLYPNDKAKKTRVDLHFKSGLRLLVTALSGHEMVDDLPKEFNVSPRRLELAFGRDAMKSDYSFNKLLYGFTPDRMNHWDFRGGMMNRDELLLMIKSIALTSAADSGIFNVRNQGYVGFQQGNPQDQPHGIVVSLYSDSGAVEMIFSQADYRKPVGVTQAEVNLVIRSLRATQPRVQAGLVN